jgi:hypothetical protein
MPYDHKIPTVLNPSGDIIVPLYIPHDPQYTSLLLGVLITLEEVERYERDPDFDDENAQIVAANWRDRTITPLIEAIATGQGVSFMPTTRIEQIDMGATHTIAGTAYGAVGGSGLSHSFSKPNAIIECHNIRLINTGANDTRVVIELDTFTADEIGEFVTSGADAREGMCISSFSNLPIGTPEILRLMSKRAAGIGTVNRYPFLLWVIREYD